MFKALQFLFLVQVKIFPVSLGLNRLMGMVLIVFTTIPAWAQSPWSGKFSAEFRGFGQQALDSRQFDQDFSVAAEPRFVYQWREDKSKVVLKAFGRWDAQDRQRSHFDLREAEWVHASEQWELRGGLRKVFWGVTESQHLVDIINQTDFVENLDGEEKLGQPMVNLAWVHLSGNWDFYVLPGFRTRTFPGKNGRLRFQTRIVNDKAYYAAANKDKHVDWALRWSKIVAGWDLGLSHFVGTSRDPLFVAEQRGLETVLVPYYEQIRQTGLDVQTVRDSWLWKGEFIVRQGHQQQYFAATAGYEYSFYGVWGPIDLGLVNEYLFNDDRDKAFTPFQNDIMLGLRVNFNDPLGKEILVGVIVDLDYTTQLWTLEANQRLNNHWKIAVKANAFHQLGPREPLYGLRRDDNIQLELAYYF